MSIIAPLGAPPAECPVCGAPNSKCLGIGPQHENPAVLATSPMFPARDRRAAQMADPNVYSDEHPHGDQEPGFSNSPDPKVAEADKRAAEGQPPATIGEHVDPDTGLVEHHNETTTPSEELEQSRAARAKAAKPAANKAKTPAANKAAKPAANKGS